MIKASYKKYSLKFKIPGGTSRGILHEKETFILNLKKDHQWGIGECALFRGLSYDDVEDYEQALQWLCNHINDPLDQLLAHLTHYPSIQFGLEQAIMSLNSADPMVLFPSQFTNGTDVIDINGLIWMGDKAFMQDQIKSKLKAGFSTIKLKIGAIDFKTEYDLLKHIRKEFSASEIILRVDANGAFSYNEALLKLDRLAKLDIHSIEQPIKAGQQELMSKLCLKTPLPIALDEELIGVVEFEQKRKLLKEINPQYIILKPSLVGGFNGCDEWISLSNSLDIDWWITSALESNIGLNAIAQYTYNLGNKLPQGLGTGGLFTNNFDSPLEVKRGTLCYDINQKWHDFSKG